MNIPINLTDSFKKLIYVFFKKIINFCYMHILACFNFIHFAVYINEEDADEILVEPILVIPFNQ